MGQHCIKTWSKTQSVIAKSSAESELYASVKSACEGLGLATLAKDMGHGDVMIKLHMDASAAMSLVDRKGLSKVRHIEVHVLLVQQNHARK